MRTKIRPHAGIDDDRHVMEGGGAHDDEVKSIDNIILEHRALCIGLGSSG